MRSFLIFIFAATPLFADEANTIEVPFERGEVIGKFLIEQEKVKPFINLAIGQYLDLSESNDFDGHHIPQNGRARQQEFENSKVVYIEEVNCDEHPHPSRSKASKNYCSFKGEASFGWYADPYFGYSVSGFILKDRVLDGSLTEAHLYENKNSDGTIFPSFKQQPIIITEVAIQTPVRTGME